MLLPRLTPTAIPQPWFAKNRTIEDELQELQYEEDRYTRERALALTTKYDAIEVEVPETARRQQQQPQQQQQQQHFTLSPPGSHDHHQQQRQGHGVDEDEANNGLSDSMSGSATPGRSGLTNYDNMDQSPIPASPEFSDDDDMMLSF